ncbi:lipid-A-disaccharide synthase N-terminal domain-containing protein [Weeksella virosa]|uniref:Lipid A biosynthesis domain protein n=1 Tax=Weeksella virosa (strain ATCC 43766 / DSM 16922 / JCM 21250 / CCUG 30538 / CDC 9751 / IAM 14551 / NBRC 16016 / NCTC 11634 / CL345/78) TaxID=865938 RepID=F0P1X5_WEEVC|nr:lipid-A-disaccharide synthase N-terminal domain-containing protein [Weeksella virosa]ADX67685.1 lipid A biosynthesis domain protein [Weeksella virosa DSM 16922]VEH64688.1 lipid-A-disaccharide synthase [Weeksella virosa]
MSTPNWFIYMIGFVAQILFSSRLILQWLISEKNKKVLTPKLFWEFSLAASILLFIYGYLRHDFAIMLGQTLTYYIYIRNIQLQNHWKSFPKIIRISLLIFPVILVVVGFNNGIIDVDNLFRNEKIPLWLLTLGILSQVMFTFRFVYQWLYSEYQKNSSLPIGFWVISLIGSFFILTYAIIRKDPVLFIGHFMGFIIYFRNIILIWKTQKDD